MEQYVLTFAVLALNAIFCSIFATSPDVFLISNALLMAAVIVKGDFDGR